MEKVNPIVYLVIILLIPLLSGCADPKPTSKDEWVEGAREGKIVMAPGYDANWDGPPLRPTSHK